MSNQHLVLPKLDNKSVAGLFLKMEDYKDFSKQMDKEEDKADFFAKIDNSLASVIDGAKDIKKMIDFETKKIKDGETRLRLFTLQYMQDKNIDKLEGSLLKSISLQKEKKSLKVVAEKQIMVGRKYVSIDDLSKDDLINLLEEKGVKTRVVTNEVEEVTKAGIRVVR